MRKTILLLILVLVVIVVYVAGARSLSARVAEMAPAVVSDIAGKLGVKIDFGEVRVSLFPSVVRIDDVRVARHEQASRPFLTIASLRFDTAPLALLTGALDVRGVVLEGARFELMRDPDGRLQSALADDFVQKLAKLVFAVRLVDAGLLAEDGTVTPPRRLTADGIDGTVSSADGTLTAALQGRIFGSSDTSKLSLKLTPDVGPTGGDSLTLDFTVSDGASAAFKDAFVVLRKVDFSDPVDLHFQASGLYGEKSTEITPATPLPGTLDGSVGLRIAGIEDRLEFEAELAIDDARYQVRRGKGSWSDFEFEPSGWLMNTPPHKISARLDFEPVGLAASCERFGIAERWRPKGELDTTIRVTGSAEEPLIRHEGKIDTLEFNGFSGVPVKASPVDVRGSLIAVNTDLSVTFFLSNLEVGTARLDHEIVGLNYWKKKISLMSMDAPFFEGVSDGAIGLEDEITVGFIYRDANAEAVLSNVIPQLALGIHGRSDGTISGHAEEKEGMLATGRVGFHRGRIDGANWIRQLVGEALTLAGRGDALATIAREATPSFGADSTRFDRIAVDYEIRGGGANLPRVVIDTDAASIRGRGTLDADGAVAIEGALLPQEALARSLVNAAPPLGSIKSAKGEMVIPFTLRADGAGTRISVTTAFRDAMAAAVAGKPVAALDIIEVGPKVSNSSPTLRQQFGR